MPVRDQVPTAHRFRPDIQGLRALAVLVVVIFHTGLGLPGGFVGVDVFFVISGFVITSMLLTEHARSGRVELGRFYLRRIRRLLPALAVVLVTVLALAPLLGAQNSGDATASTARAGALFVANVHLMLEPDGYFDPASELNPFLHLWTLSVEEQFYLGFPLLLLGAGWVVRWRAGRRGPGPGLGPLAAGARGAPVRDRNGALVPQAEPAPLAAGGRSASVGERSTAMTSRLAIGLVAAAALASFALAMVLQISSELVLGLEGSGPRVLFYSAPTRAWEFLAGVLLAMVLARRARRARRALRDHATRSVGWTAGAVLADACGFGGLALLAWAVLGFDEGNAFPGVVGLVPVAAAVLLVLAGSGTGRGPSAVGGGGGAGADARAGAVGIVSRALSVVPARWVGDRSYGWYLWHWPLIVFARALFPADERAPAVAAVLALALAAGSYRLVEQPVRAGLPVPRATLALGAACIAAPLVVAALLGPVADRLDDNPTLAASGAERAFHLDYTRRCVDNLPDPASRDECTWQAPGADGGPTPDGAPPGSSRPSGPGAGESVPGERSRRSAVLLGDSNAGHFSEGFREAAHSLGLDAVVQTRAGCPFADLAITQEGRTDDSCRAFYERQMAAIEADPPAVVVLASAADLHATDDSMTLLLDEGRWATRPDTKLEAWQSGLARTLGRLDRLGVPVVVMQPVPRFTDWLGAGACARLRVLIDEAGCATERRTADTRPVGDGVLVADAAAAGGLDSVELVDVSAELCPGVTCSPYQDGTWVFRDPSHISVASSIRLAPTIATAMDSVLAR